MELTCPNCHIKSTGDFPVQKDEDNVRMNMKYLLRYERDKIDYSSRLCKYNIKVEEYIGIIKEHNASKHFWEEEWKLESQEYGLTYIYTDGTFGSRDRITEYPDFCYPSEPRLFKLLTHYIECPVCHHKHYFRMEK